MTGKTLKNKDPPPKRVYVHVVYGFTMISLHLQMTFSCDFLAESFMEKRKPNNKKHRIQTQTISEVSKEKNT